MIHMRKGREMHMIGVVLGIFGVVAFGAIAYSITHEAKKSEKDRMDKWADYEHRKRD